MGIENLNPKLMQPSSRMYDLDWLRVIAIVLVLYFHVAMIFTSEWDWHIKNAETSNLWLEFNFWLSKFRMPLLFFISGVGSYFALRKRSGWTYMKERHNRLMIPLIFAMFFVVPPQLFYERLFAGESYASFFTFYPKVLEFQPYPDGNFSWHHMWFVLYLFVYSAIALPLFLGLKSEKGKHFINKLSTIGKSKAIYLLTLPTVIIYFSLTIHFSRTNDLINDFGWLPYWFTFFVVGFIVAGHQQFWEGLLKYRKTSLQLAFLCIVLMNYIRWNGLEPWDLWQDSWRAHWESYAYLALYPLDAWFWLLAIIGYGRKYLNKPSKFLAYSNRGIYPFYILHQTVIVVIGYYVIQVQESISAKYIFVSTLSLILTVVLYDFLIKPFPIMRFLFGMKPEKKKVVKEVEVEFEKVNGMV